MIYEPILLNKKKMSYSKKLVRLLVPSKSMKRKNESFKEEILKLNIRTSGTSKNGSYVELMDGTRFNSFKSSGIALYSLYFSFPRNFRKMYSFDVLKCLLDIVIRYHYPHMDPSSVPNYSHEVRRQWHKQHHDTIDDFDISSERKIRLKRIFSFRKGDHILDIGAHTGMGAMSVVRDIGIEGSIACVEADTKCYDILVLNLNENKIENIVPMNYAVWSNGSSKEFHSSKYQANGLVEEVLKGTNSSSLVQGITIDTIWKILGWPKVDYISLTINGAEFEALKGALKTLKENRKIKISLCGWYELNGVKISQLVIPFLENLGFHCEQGGIGRILAYRKEAWDE
jgi:FkbM family methyltransferase